MDLSPFLSLVCLVCLNSVIDLTFTDGIYHHSDLVYVLFIVIVLYILLLQMEYFIILIQGWSTHYRTCTRTYSSTFLST